MNLFSGIIDAVGDGVKVVVNTGIDVIQAVPEVVEEVIDKSAEVINDVMGNLTGEK